LRHIVKDCYAEWSRRADVHEEIANGHRMVFRATGEMLALIMKTAEMESQCCKFLRFQITNAPAPASTAAGDGVPATSTMQTIRIPVEGMSCVACAARR
jgi:hypothetical protein